MEKEEEDVSVENLGIDWIADLRARLGLAHDL
jgi:hypothetical protein